MPVLATCGSFNRDKKLVLVFLTFWPCFGVYLAKSSPWHASTGKNDAPHTTGALEKLNTHKTKLFNESKKECTNFPATLCNLLIVSLPITYSFKSQPERGAPEGIYCLNYSIVPFERFLPKSNERAAFLFSPRRSGKRLHLCGQSDSSSP